MAAKLQIKGSTKSKRPLQDILKEAFPEDDVGGPSGFGWHATSTYMACNRLAYYKMVAGLRKKRNSDALNFGTLMHACLAFRYMTDDVRTYEPIEAVRSEYPELAKEAEVALRKLKARYGDHDSRFWDPIAAEYEARYTFHGQPSWTNSIEDFESFFTCRYDLVVGVKGDGEPRKAPGELHEAARITDHKCHGRLYYDLIPGYRWDPQFITQSLIWREAGLDNIIGPLQGVTISIYIRERTQKDPMMRLQMRYDTETLDNAKPVVEQAIVDCQSKMQFCKDDIKMWPQNFAACKTPYGLCEFFELCESNGRATYAYESQSSYKTSAVEAIKNDGKENE